MCTLIKIKKKKSIGFSSFCCPSQCLIGSIRPTCIVNYLTFLL